MKEIKIPSLDFDKFKLVDTNTGEVVEYSLKDELGINRETYQLDFINQPAKYVYWQAVLQNLKTYEESVQRSSDIQHAHSYNYAYNYLKTKAKVTRPTKDMIESIIMRDKDYQQTLEKVEEAKENVGIVNAIVKAYEQRRDMLIQLGADERLSKQNSN